MLLILFAKNKICFADETVAILNDCTCEYKLWSKCNDLVFSSIIFNGDKNISRCILFSPVARKIWLDQRDIDMHQ